MEYKFPWKTICSTISSFSGALTVSAFVSGSKEAYLLSEAFLLIDTKNSTVIMHKMNLELAGISTMTVTYVFMGLLYFSAISVLG